MHRIMSAVFPSLAVLAIVLVSKSPAPATAVTAAVQGGQLLTVTIDDPTGDVFAPGHIDVVWVALNVYPATGDYEVLLEASDSGPFVGEFRINLNLFNMDGPTTRAASFFQDVANDFDLNESTTTMRLVGNSSALRSWSSGDIVFTNNLCDQIGGICPVPERPFGIALFRSAVASTPFGFLSNEDLINAPSNVPVVVREASAGDRIDFLSFLVRASSVGNEDPLLRKLEAARRSLGRGNSIAAMNQLLAFVNQVDALVSSGRLDRGEAEALKPAASATVDRIMDGS